jgi:hypothetical protein
MEKSEKHEKSVFQVLVFKIWFVKRYIGNLSWRRSPSVNAVVEYGDVVSDFEWFCMFFLYLLQ